MSGLRGDVREMSTRRLRRECPHGCDGAQEHTRVGQYPAVARSGAWGKYLNPVYLCHGCLRTHTLLSYETPQDADRPEWGEYPPNRPDVDGPKTAQRLTHLNGRTVDADVTFRGLVVMTGDAIILDDGDTALSIIGSPIHNADPRLGDDMEATGRLVQDGDGNRRLVAETATTVERVEDRDASQVGEP